MSLCVALIHHVSGLLLCIIQLIMSSSQLASIQQPVVALDLVVTENGKRRTETLELSRDELSRMVTSLEAANKVSCVLC